VTSSSNILNIRLTKPTTHSSQIFSSITDHSNHKVGVTVSGDDNGHEKTLQLSGAFSNTFTGKLTVSGSAQVILNKSAGKTAVSGDILVEKGGRLTLSRSDQIKDTSIITLHSSIESKRSKLEFDGSRKETIIERVHTLKIENSGSLLFDKSKKSTAQKYLYLNNLVIGQGGKLVIEGWISNRDHLLVKKDSKNLEDSLKKIDFSGYNRWTIGKRSFNKDYWEIYAVLPEPSTYGASLLLFGLVAKAIRRSVRKPPFNTSPKEP